MLYFHCSFFSFLFFVETKGRHANAKAQEASDHLASLCQLERRFSNRESNRHPLPRDLGISPPSFSSLGWSRTMTFIARSNSQQMQPRFIHLRCVGVIWFVFRALQLYPDRFTQQNSCSVIKSTNKSMKHLQKNNLKIKYINPHDCVHY